MIKDIIDNLVNNSNFYIDLIGSHIKITLIAVLLAIVLGLIIGIFISEHRKYASVLIGVVNVVYTVPSIALLGFLIPFTGIGNTTAIIAITIYGLLPIVRSTYIGIVNIDEKIIEASEAMGSSKSQILYKIKLPLAMPIILSAIRNMVTMTIALAGIASFVGAGGLGVAIYRGITTNNKILIFNGSIIIALLALFFDFVLALVEKRILSRKKISKSKIISVFIVILIVISSLFIGNMNRNKTIHLASKPTTEGYILAEISRLLIEDKTKLHVKVTHGVGGGTSNLHPALVKGDFDLYPEYTGTSWQVVLKRKDTYNESMFNNLVGEYEKRYQATWLGMFGFNNTYGLGIHKDLASKYNLKTYSDLSKYASELVFGAEYDFFEREDGFNALAKAYNFKFKNQIDMDNGLKYQALLDKKIDVMTIFTTDGRLSNPNIVVLKDDLNFYPSYKAGMVIRQDVLKKHPELKDVLKLLDNLLDEKTISKLNDQVETNKEKPEDVAKKFLKERKLIGG